MSKHNAPSVIYPLVRSRLQGLLLLGVWLAGLLVVVLWYLSSPPSFTVQTFAGLAVVGSGFFAHLGWKNTPGGSLAWDGQQWRLESPGYQNGVEVDDLIVLADFQHVLLLQIENQAHAKIWLFVQRSSMPSRWLELRRAVYSPQRALIASSFAG